MIEGRYLLLTQSHWQDCGQGEGRGNWGTLTWLFRPESGELTTLSIND